VVRPISAVIFDMDGTLVQTRQSSWEVFRVVSNRFGLGIDTPDKYYELFQGNVFERIKEACSSEAQARELTAAFIAALESDYHPQLIPGMSAVVRRLAGVATLAVLSSNAMKVVRRVLVDNDLAFCFAHVFGGDVTPDKKAAIREFIADTGSGFGRRCSADYDEEMEPALIMAEGTVLVTDTAGDVREATKVGIRSIGVAWGMHSVEQLTEAGAEFVALWPQEVGSYLLRGISAEPRGACALPQVSATTDRSCSCRGACTGACSETCGRTCGGSCRDGSLDSSAWSVVAAAAAGRGANRVAPPRSSVPPSVRARQASSELRLAVASIIAP
jgi:phosphoglycolate phosphatase